MARQARERSASGVYYLRIDSLDKLIFIGDGDREQYLGLLFERASLDYAEIYAYCLCPEQIHLVVKEGLDGVSALVRAVSSRYALWYNARYRREGRLFADRFKSLPLEEPDETLDAVRYVVRLLGEPLARPETSYTPMMRGEIAAELTALSGHGRLSSYMAAPSVFNGIGRDRISDAELLAAARDILFTIGADKLDQMDEDEYYAVLKKLLSVKGATLGQVSRVCGISRRRLERAARGA